MPRRPVKSPHDFRITLVSFALLLAVLICYGQTLRFEFVNYDDHRYITGNPHVQEGFHLRNVAWAFTTFEVANWHPVTWLSHMLDVEIFGLDHPGGHHMINVVIHAANTLLLLMALRRMTGALWRSALAAALFALHPLHVESVAWVSERKDVLSVCFGLLAIHHYISYSRQPTVGRMSGVAGWFALSLMSKPMLMTLPALLLVLDFWPLRRFDFAGTGPPMAPPSPARTTGNTASSFTRRRFTGLLMEKWPLFAMAMASGAITIMAQSRGGAVSDLATMSPSARFSNALVAYVIYIRQMFWPLDLAPFYPLPDGRPIGTTAACAGVVLAITGVVVMRMKSQPHLLTGWLWYLGTLLPVIGLVQVGSQAHADRYTYFPMIGLFVMFAFSVPAAVKRRVAGAIGAISGIVLALLMTASWVQAGYWRDSVTLSERALRVTTDNAVAHFNLANALIEQGNVEPALEQFRLAAESRPKWADPPYNLGNALRRTGRFSEAIEAYDEAIHRNAEFGGAWVNRGIALAQQGEQDAAIASLERALSISADDADAHLNLGQVFAAVNRLPEAITQFEETLQTRPDDPVAHLMLGNALARSDRLDEAIRHFARSLEVNPNDPRAHMSMAAALADRGEIDAAMNHLRTAAELARASGRTSLLEEIGRRAERLRGAALNSINHPPPGP